MGALYMSTPGVCMRRSNERSHYKGRACPNKTHPRRTAHGYIAACVGLTETARSPVAAGSVSGHYVPNQPSVVIHGHSLLA
jgi:hypothetical protein